MNIVYGIGYKCDDGEYEVEELTFSKVRGYVEKEMEREKMNHPYPENFKIIKFIEIAEENDLPGLPKKER